MALERPRHPVGVPGELFPRPESNTRAALGILICQHCWQKAAAGLALLTQLWALVGPGPWRAVRRPLEEQSRAWGPCWVLAGVRGWQSRPPPSGSMTRTSLWAAVLVGGAGAPGTLSASLLLPPASWAARGGGTVPLPGGEGSPPCSLVQTRVSL